VALAQVMHDGVAPPSSEIMLRDLAPEVAECLHQADGCIEAVRERMLENDRLYTQLELADSLEWLSKAHRAIAVHDATMSYPREGSADSPAWVRPRDHAPL
jgi:hypothetical protein